MRNLMRLSSWLAALTVAGVFLLPGNYALAATEEQLAKNNSITLHNGDHATTTDYPYVAQKMTVTDRTVSAFTFWLSSVGTPDGNLYFDIWEYGADEDIGTILYSQLLTSDLTDIEPGGGAYTFNLSSPIWLNGTYRIGLTSTALNSGINDRLFVWYQSTDVKGSEYIQRYHVFDSAWEGTDAWGDLYYSYTYTAGGGAPNVETLVAAGTSIAGQMSLSGMVNLIGETEVTLTGVEWGTSTGNYTSNETSVVSITDNTTIFQEIATGLINGTTYYWRAMAQNSEGINYGAEKTFQMGSVPTLHITRAWMNAAGTDLQATAVIDDDAGSTITAAGVYFDTISGGTSIHRTPTSVPQEDEEWSVIASSEGVLDTRYFATAYAITSAGTAYSVEVTFIAGKSEYVYNDSGTGVDIILPITTALNSTLESVGMDNGPGRTLAAFLVIAAAWFFFRDKKPLNIIMPVVAFAAMFAIGWIEIWLIIVGAALIGVILYFTAGRRASSHA